MAALHKRPPGREAPIRQVGNVDAVKWDLKVTKAYKTFYISFTKQLIKRHRQPTMAQRILCEQAALLSVMLGESTVEALVTAQRGKVKLPDRHLITYRLLQQTMTTLGLVGSSTVKRDDRDDVLRDDDA